MIYGKISTSVASPDHGRLHLTISGHTVSLKQNGDLIRLTLDEARELAQDLRDGIATLLETATDMDASRNCDFDQVATPPQQTP